LTAEAKDYLPGVRAAFNDLRLATDRVLRKDNDHVLTVSTLASLAAKWLLPRLSAFQEAHPDIDVHITTSASLVDSRAATSMPRSAMAAAIGRACVPIG
jgi:Transcriptional regulator